MMILKNLTDRLSDHGLLALELLPQLNIVPSARRLVAGSFLSEVQDWAESITSGANMTGRLLVTFMIVCNIIAMILYIIDVQSGLVEECVSWEEKLTIQIDFALGIIFREAIKEEKIKNEWKFPFRTIEWK